MTKQKFHKTLLSEFLFWLHFLIFLFVLFAGLFIAWFWVIVFLVALRLQQIIFHGCIITVFARHEGVMGKHLYFYKVMARRFIGYKLQQSGVTLVYIVHNLASICIAILAGPYHLRIGL